MILSCCLLTIHDFKVKPMCAPQRECQIRVWVVCLCISSPSFDLQLRRFRSFYLVLAIFSHVFILIWLCDSCKDKEIFWQHSLIHIVKWWYHYSYKNWCLLYLKNTPKTFGRNNVRAKKEPPRINKSWSFVGIQITASAYGHLKSVKHGFFLISGNWNFKAKKVYSTWNWFTLLCFNM